jgi:cytoskeletal protein CcmA (bactofilin family)
VVGSAGRVIADVEAREIVVCGRVRGDIRGERVQITAGASMIGDVVAQRIGLEDGAELRGNLDTTRTLGPAIPASRVKAATATSAGRSAMLDKAAPLVTPPLLRATEVASGV